MNWFRAIGAFVALVGAVIVLLAVWISIPTIHINESAGIGASGGVLPILEMFIGLVLVIAGLCIAVIGGRSKRQLP